MTWFDSKRVFLVNFSSERLPPGAKQSTYVRSHVGSFYTGKCPSHGNL